MLELQRARESIAVLTDKLEEARANIITLTNELNCQQIEVDDLRTELKERFLSSELSLHEKTQQLQMQINMLMNQNRQQSQNEHSLEDTDSFSSRRSNRPPPRLSRMSSLDDALQNF